jgi:putative flippase GtrA
MSNTPAILKHARQTILFCIIGGTGALIDMGTLFIIVHNQIFQAEIGFVLSAAMAMIFVFFMNKFITFQSHTLPTIHQAQRFILVYFPAAIINTAISTALLTIGFQYMLAKLIAIGCVACMNYILSHYFIFKHYV